MEGAKGLKRKRVGIAIAIIILFHAVGLAGFFIHLLQPLFLKLVPFHLLLMLAVIFYSYSGPYFKFILFSFLIAGCGYLGEWIGVHTHLIFGDYVYGRTLGVKWHDIPLTIGVNWLLLIYSAGVLVQHLRIKRATTRVIIGAVILILLDLIIEPVAVRFHYWHWIGHAGYLTAPVKNYIAWFGVSALFLAVFEAFSFKKQNIVGAVLLITQFVFFGLMHWAR